MESYPWSFQWNKEKSKTANEAASHDHLCDGCGKCNSDLTHLPSTDRLVRLVVKASTSRAEDPGFESRLRLDFSASSPTRDLKIGTPVATPPGAWRYRVNAGTGWPGVSILWLGEVESLICNFYLSVAARQIDWADPPLRYTACCLDVKQASNQIHPMIGYHSVWKKDKQLAGCGGVF